MGCRKAQVWADVTILIPPYLCLMAVESLGNWRTAAPRRRRAGPSPSRRRDPVRFVLTCTIDLCGMIFAIRRRQPWLVNVGVRMATSGTTSDMTQGEKHPRHLGWFCVLVLFTICCWAGCASSKNDLVVVENIGKYAELRTASETTTERMCRKRMVYRSARPSQGFIRNASRCSTHCCRDGANSRLCGNPDLVVVAFATCKWAVHMECPGSSYRYIYIYICMYIYILLPSGWRS